jgi:UDP-N-acetylmuramate: L-alanyl-gamma-D-glutamyl-meso-diaminopimelate ligase
MGVDEDDFYEAIAFKGFKAIRENCCRTKVAYKDFAHSPSKVAATTQAVKNSTQIGGCLELHTYSSLNSEF